MAEQGERTMNNNLREESKAEFKQQFMDAIAERFTPEELELLAEKFDVVTEKFVFNKKTVHE